MTSAPMASVNDDIAENIRTNCVGFAAFTILIWDHVDTFASEVEYIWQGKKGIVVYLFLLNRYLTPLGFIVNLFAYLSPVWIHQVPPFRPIRGRDDRDRHPCRGPYDALTYQCPVFDEPNTGRCRSRPLVDHVRRECVAFNARTTCPAQSALRRTSLHHDLPT
ncbi:hypothetical protein B0H12DRAFT_389110 [Mycena haematopus]|nr:hypothetical protein B0H12DRAFT_389110 [Mycena haematopus]